MGLPVGDFFASLRERHLVSKARMARLLGVSPTRLRSIESSDNMTLENFVTLCERLGLDPPAALQDLLDMRPR